MWTQKDELNTCLQTFRQMYMLNGSVWCSFAIPGGYDSVWQGGEGGLPPGPPPPLPPPLKQRPRVGGGGGGGMGEMTKQAPTRTLSEAGTIWPTHCGHPPTPNKREKNKKKLRRLWCQEYRAHHQPTNPAAASSLWWGGGVQPKEAPTFRTKQASPQQYGSPCTKQKPDS